MSFNRWGLGICAKCGDQNGPWVLTDQGWLCENCAGENENAGDKVEDDSKGKRNGIHAQAENEGDG